VDNKLKQRLLSESTYVGTLGLLLENDVASAIKKAAGISKAISNRKTKITSLIGGLPSGGYKSGLEKLLGSIFEGEDEINKLFDLGDDPSEEDIGKLGGGIDQLSAKSREVKSLLSINSKLMAFLAQQIIDANLHKGEDKDVPLETIFEEAEMLEDAKKEMKKVLEKAVQKAPKKKPKGFFASIADALGFGETPSMGENIEKAADGLIDAILELTPIEVGQFAMKLADSNKEAAKEDEEIQKATDGANEEIEDEAGKPDEEAEAGELKTIEPEDLESASITMNYEGEQLFFAENYKKFQQDLTSSAGIFHKPLVDADADPNGFENKIEVTIAPEPDESRTDYTERKAKLSDLKGSFIDEFKKAMDKYLLDALKEGDPGDFEYDRAKEAIGFLFDKSKAPKGDDEEDGSGEDEELTGEDADLNEEEVEEADDLADKGEDVLGNLPFGKLELTKLLKAFPELAGKGNKATTQRRAFRKAMNQAAGQQIFEEGKSDNLDTETFKRLRKLAGIK